MAVGMVHLHNVMRWLILILLLWSILKAYSGWKNKKIFTRSDKRIWLFTLISAHINFLIGLYLLLAGRYGVLTSTRPEGSPLMKDKFYRFFWIEHPTGMILAIILITIGNRMGKSNSSDTTKFRKAFWYFLIALIVILITIPWPWREIVGRPWFPGMQ
ncbi:MAG: hypothetical protein C5B52_07130 [Bacteroidetes bacterium]|nr:MAG: hypothetical protein C5B52_07130 [Bacteroidota bacterium]